MPFCVSNTMGKTTKQQTKRDRTINQKMAIPINLTRHENIMITIICIDKTRKQDLHIHI